jgi:hypothetical protein
MISTGTTCTFEGSNIVLESNEFGLSGRFNRQFTGFDFSNVTKYSSEFAGSLLFDSIASLLSNRLIPPTFLLVSTVLILSIPSTGPDSVNDQSMLDRPIDSDGTSISNCTMTFFRSDFEGIVSGGFEASVNMRCSPPIAPSFYADPSSLDGTNIPDDSDGNSHSVHFHSQQLDGSQIKDSRQLILSECFGASAIVPTTAFDPSSMFGFEIWMASTTEGLGRVSVISPSLCEVTRIVSLSSPSETIYGGSDLGSHSMVLIGLGPLSPEQADGKGSGRTEVSTRIEYSLSLSLPSEIICGGSGVGSHSMVLINFGPLSPEQAYAKGSGWTEVSAQIEGSLSLSLPGEVTVLRGGAVSENEHSADTISGVAWIGIGVGVIALLAAIALAIWLGISRRRQELSEELPSSMEFVTETDEELGRLCGRMQGGTEWADLGNGPPFAVGDPPVHVFEESYV